MKNNIKYIDQSGVTIITEIASGDHLKNVKELLGEIGKDDTGGGIMDFKSISSMHFARWFIIDDAKVSDGKGGYSSEHQFPISLVFTSNFDGKTKEHLQEIVSINKEVIISIYSHCKSFPKGDKDSISTETIVKYLLKHSKKNQLFWPAIRGGTVEQLLGESKLKARIQSFVNDTQKNNTLKGKSPSEIKKELYNLIRNDSELNWAVTPRAKPSFGWYLKYYGKLIYKLLFIIPVALLFGLFFITAWMFNKKDNKYRKEINRAKDLEDLLNNEDRIFMNQLTVYGGIKKPYWYRTIQLRIGLWLFSLNGVYRSTKGKLSGIETIHFARWTLFNKGKNVIFLSNYDGAWEIYLSEFIDRSAAAMNLTFGTTVGYPKVKGLLGEGAHDEQAFKTVVRNNQYPCQVWYSAYPTLTVKNILNNQEIRKGLAGKSKESVSDWLKRL